MPCSLPVLKARTFHPYAVKQRRITKLVSTNSSRPTLPTLVVPTATMAPTTATTVTARSKHWVVQQAYMSEQEELQEIDTRKVGTDDNHSDGLTKNSGGPKYWKHASWMHKGGWAYCVEDVGGHSPNDTVTKKAEAIVNCLASVLTGE